LSGLHKCLLSPAQTSLHDAVEICLTLQVLHCTCLLWPGTSHWPCMGVQPGEHTCQGSLLCRTHVLHDRRLPEQGLLFWLH
jgi:hypothetical protein